MLKLRSREDLALPSRLALSADHTADVNAVTAWMRERAASRLFEVTRVPFDELRGWHFSPSTGNLVHDSGRFFSIQGLRVQQAGTAPAWYQPIINQPEVGILGILAKEFDGILHFLMQAKTEPGNPQPLMLSPTVQATWSNYTQVHRGSKVKYLEYFNGPGRGRVIADVLQSEHGDWFFQKRNRNIVVEVDVDVPLEEDFRWLTLGQINELMNRDNVINMDSRSVLACLPQAGPAPWSQADGFRAALAASRDPGAGALSSTAEVLSWFTGLRAECALDISRIPLHRLPGWNRTRTEIVRHDGRLCRVVAVDIRGEGREVAAWTQPLIEPCGQGLSAFLVKEFAGVLHLLVHARAEGGFMDAVELGPTVQCVAGDRQDSPFLAQVPEAGSPRIRYEAIHAEEGGRFLNAESRYLIAEADDRTSADQLPPGYTWVTVGQLAGLLQHGQYVNVQARTLLACLNSIR